MSCIRLKIIPVEASSAQVLTRFSCHMGLLYVPESQGSGNGKFAFFDSEQVNLSLAGLVFLSSSVRAGQYSNRPE